jgi:hypothetical protein
MAMGQSKYLMRQAAGGHKTGIVAGALVLLGFVAACGTATTSSSAPTATISSNSPTATASALASTPDATTGWVSYTSTANHLKFKHPADMKPLECGWVFIDPSNPAYCPQGDGFCCMFLRSSDNGQAGGFSLISDHRDLFSDVQQTSVTVDGIAGTRLSGTQTEGQGGGPQVEYDFTANGRTYNFLAIVSGPGALVASAPSASVFDQIVQTAVFTS